MKFTGELKFPEIDHPGVPVQFVIDGTQAELLVEEESLGRWSLYDVRARRLVASAFQIELDGDEVTFVADDPVEFAYRGVEHMAETWATLKSKRVAGRTIAVRKSRKGTIASRIEDMREAMLSNLEDDAAPRHLAGEVVTSDSPAATPSVDAPPSPDESPDSHDSHSDELQWIEEEKRRLAAERARLDEERRLAERREEDRVEAFRLEMDRLRAEREALQRGGVEQDVETEPVEAERSSEADVEEPVVPLGSEVEPDVVEPTVEPVDELVDEPVDETVDELVDEPVVEPMDEPFDEPADETAGEPVDEPLDEPADETAGEPVDEPVSGVVDLNDLEEGEDPVSERESVGTGSSPGPPQTSVGASNPRERGGLMGAVRAAFRAGSRDHDHRFIEAPGGIGITRYVCEECGHVSISA